MLIRYMPRMLLDKAGEGDGGGGGAGGSGGGSNNPSGDGQNPPNKGGGQGGGDGDDPSKKGEKGSEGGDGDDPGDPPDMTEEQKKYFQKLRKENAKYRQRAKDSESKLGALEERFSKFEGGLKQVLGVEDDNGEGDPEDQIALLNQKIEEMESRSVMNELIRENQVPAQAQEYFEFLLNKEAEEHEEGIPDEVIAKIAQKAKASVSGNSSSSVNTGEPGSGNPPNPQTGGGHGDVTLEQFASMSIMEKSEMYRKDPDSYNALMTRARQEKKLVPRR